MLVLEEPGGWKEVTAQAGSDRGLVQAGRGRGRGLGLLYEQAPISQMMALVPRLVNSMPCISGSQHWHGPRYIPAPC